MKEIFLTMFEKYFNKMLFEWNEESYLNVLRSKIYHIGVANTSFAEGVYHVLKAQITAKAELLLGRISCAESTNHCKRKAVAFGVFHVSKAQFTAKAELLLKHCFYKILLFTKNVLTN